MSGPLKLEFQMVVSCPAGVQEHLPIPLTFSFVALFVSFFQTLALNNRLTIIMSALSCILQSLGTALLYGVSFDPVPADKEDHR